jgi:hypothetical protein
MGEGGFIFDEMVVHQTKQKNWGGKMIGINLKAIVLVILIVAVIYLLFRIIDRKT